MRTTRIAFSVQRVLASFLICQTVFFVTDHLDAQGFAPEIAASKMTVADGFIESKQSGQSPQRSLILPTFHSNDW